MDNETRERMIHRLQAGASRYACSGYLLTLNSLYRYDLFLKLIFDRLERKIALVEQLYEESLQNWNQTFYLLYFRTLGDSSNQQNYLELARRVPYKIVLRERRTPLAVEAMLLGASGLLDFYEDDDYTSKLRFTYAHLAAKYEIEPLDPYAWKLATIRPVNHPVLRLAEAAAFFLQDEFMIDRIMQCRTEEDVRKLFRIEAPEYWRTHFVPGSATDFMPKCIGKSKADIIGINLVSILQFAYGSYMKKDYLRDSALELLEHIPAEDNRYIRAWYNAGGIKAKTAFESQALLQLATKYCAEKRCEECPVGKRILKSIDKNC